MTETGTILRNITLSTVLSRNLNLQKRNYNIVHKKYQEELNSYVVKKSGRIETLILSK